MILGIGIDLIETRRIRESLERFKDRFLNRVFLPGEIEYCRQMKFPMPHYAARFAAKEAASKAFGTGIGRMMGWKNIEVRNHESGQPYLVLHGEAAELAKARGVSGSVVSLTHHESAAAAVVVLYSDNRE